MFVLFTDFSYLGPYLGQIKSYLMDQAPNVPVVDLMHDAPLFDAKASAYLLSACLDAVPKRGKVIAVVDPGVGGERRSLALHADGRWLFGPDNGLLSVYARRAEQVQAYQLPVPASAAASFHGRDVFAPFAVRIAAGETSAAHPVDVNSLIGWDWPAQLAEVIYIDSFGNAVTGLRADTLEPDVWLEVRGRRLPPHRTFSDVEPGKTFWYRNSNGLVELAANRGRAVDVLGLQIGEPVLVRAPL